MPCSPATQRLDELAPHARARVLADKTLLDAWVNTYNIECAEQALAIARELDDPALLARALTACWQRRRLRHRGGLADTSLRRIGLARALGDQWRLSQILGQQAQAALVTGDTIALRASAAEGREIADAIGDRFGSRQCGWRLATAYLVQGDLTGAIALLRGVVAEAEAEHDGISRVTALLILPQALAHQGDADAARVAAEGAIESAAELGDVYIGAVYVELMIAHLAAGDVALARKRPRPPGPTGWPSWDSSAQQLWLIAQVALARGDLTAARRGADDDHRGDEVGLEPGECADDACSCGDR